MVKLSVIVPTYNREKYLSKALQNLKAQTLKDIEFILVDDGSQDNTAKILKKEIEGDKRFQLIKYKENKGPSYARNRGLKLAEGDYIGFFDVDDHITPDYYETLYKTAIENKADIAFAAAGNAPRTLKDKINLLRKGGIWDKIYKKDLLDKYDILFEEGLFTADTLFTLQTVYYAPKLCLTNKVQYDYSVKKDSISSTKQAATKRKDDLFVIIGKMRDFAREKEFTQDEIDALNAFMERCFLAYPKDKNFQKKLAYVFGYKEKRSPGKELFCLHLKKTFQLISTSAYKEQRAMILFRNSNLFDGKWYLMQYPEARNSKLEPEQHYYRTGWKNGCNPSAIFDGNAYLAEHPDVKNVGRNPLEHYLLSGRYEGRYYVSVNGKAEPHPVEGIQILPKTKTPFFQKIKYMLEYPVRVQEEYERLKAEIRELKK